MKVHGSRLALAPMVLYLFTAGPALAQKPAADDLKKDMEALKESVKAIQKDLQEIKAMLASARPAQPPSKVVIDLGDNPTKGESAAKLTMVEFSDYQCPFCGRYARETYGQIAQEYVAAGKLKYVFVDTPLEAIHKLAFKAAEVADCAGEQGKYWEMHHRLFANQGALEPWGAHAEALGLDTARFEQCLSDGKYATEIRRDLEEARKANVTGTPTFFIGVMEPGASRIKTEVRLSGARPYADFKAEIAKQLAALSAPAPADSKK